MWSKGCNQGKWIWLSALVDGKCPQYQGIPQGWKIWECTRTCGWTGRGGSRGSVHMLLSSRLSPGRVPYTGVTATPYCEPGSSPDSVAEVPRAAYCFSGELPAALEPAWIRRRSTCNRSVTDSVRECSFLHPSVSVKAPLSSFLQRCEDYKRLMLSTL